MPRGGKREGAGRKRGTANKRTREIANRAARAGLTPLEYMLRRMRDSKADRQARDDMAKAAAPYIHPRLSSIEGGGPGTEPVKVETTGDELTLEGARRVAFTLAMGAKIAQRKPVVAKAKKA